MTPRSAITLLAEEHLDPEGHVIRSAECLAKEVLRLLAEGETVHVAMEKLPGLPSSYFSMLLRLIADERGLDCLGKALTIDPGSRFQERVFRRSLDAVRKQPR